MSDQANVAVIQSIYDKFSRGDIPGILNQLDPRAELVYEGPAAIPWTGNRRGRDEWAKFFRTTLLRTSFGSPDVARPVVHH